MFWVLFAMAANAAYVAALPSATIFYVANVLLHLVLGAAGVGWLLWKWRRSTRALPLALAAALGVYLVFAGATFDHRAVLWAHIALAAAGLAVLMPRWTAPLAATFALALALRVGRPAERIRNPHVVPVSMREEGERPGSPFWPSSSRTNTGGLIPSDFFMDSKKCGECHKDIYEEWKSSMHHFASFNNPFYRATILDMQEKSGVQGSKWCAGCHDHAVFFNGRFERPIKEQVNTPEAQNGLGCVSCHSIAHVYSTMGNADFEIMYPPLHRLADSDNPVLKRVDAFVTYLNPEPHRRTFLKPFMTTSEYCSVCHKAHLDEPVNHYRWLRGFNEYDNWQASGVSGEGARSFYYPAKPAGCIDCHMPLRASSDPGNRYGMVHSHRFAAANTAVPTVNHDQEQLRAVEAFLKSGFITVDLFAASPVDQAASNRKVEMERRAGEAPALASTFAVGEEAEQSGPVTIRQVGKVMAPLDAPGAAFQPGTTVRVDAVVRTRKIGHFFPGGTVDGFDVWLEFKATDADGRVLAWSGSVADNGRGPVDPGAHFYRSYLIDAEGNHIDKRNAWQAHSVVYVRLIPPGAADTVHYLVEIPRDAKGPVRLEAHLDYRKFTASYTHFTFADKPALTPVLPIVTVASAATSVALGEPRWQPVVRRQDRERWNDWGIGLLLQGDLKGAEYAFQRVTEAEPGYPDGWVNVARALVQEGETEAARSYLEKALALQPRLARAEFFLASVDKTAGDYPGALRNLQDVERQYPRDRVAIDQIGRVLFLERRYAEAIRAFEQTLTVDPEDLEAHYNLMLCYRGLGDSAQAAREEQLFRRFKADEASQALTAQVRMASPEDNNERQPIHDHTSRRDVLAARAGVAAAPFAGRHAASGRPVYLRKPATGSRWIAGELR